MAEFPFIPFVNENKASFAWETYFTLFCGVGGMMDIAQDTMTRTGCASYLWGNSTQELHLLVHPTFARVFQESAISGSRYYWGIDMTSGKYGGILNTCTWVVTPTNLPQTSSWRLEATNRFSSPKLGEDWKVSTYHNNSDTQSREAMKQLIDPASWKDIVSAFWTGGHEIQPNPRQRAIRPHWHSPLFTRGPQGFGYVTDYYHPPSVYLPSLS